MRALTVMHPCTEIDFSPSGVNINQMFRVLIPVLLAV